jgi:dTDP-4-amino-4,6-dideoxygalactose transaminase
MKIPFNKPFLIGSELEYIEDAVRSGKISGNGKYTKKCHEFFEKQLGFKKVLLTSSCTDALEMAAILADIQEGDEVIIPSYTFVSTALAFIRQGAKVVFADSNYNNPNIDADEIEVLITSKTKAIVPVHYAGIACDMDKIMTISRKYNLIVIEDAAQAIDSYFISANGEVKQLGTIGHFAAFSFHETKNIISGEGGLLAINCDDYLTRSEIIWEKGTNRSQFFRGEVDKYGWVDTGSSFLPSEITAAFLWAQLENISLIQEKRKQLWDYYYSKFKKSGLNQNLKLPFIPIYATNNGHMFYICFKSLEDRTSAIEYLKKNDILAVFHYSSLHKSSFYKDKHDGRKLELSDSYTDTLLRLPLYYDLTFKEIDLILECLN